MALVSAAHVANIHLTAEIPGLSIRVPFAPHRLDRTPLWMRPVALRRAERKAARQAEWDADKPRRDAIEAAQQAARPNGRQPRGF